MKFLITDNSRELTEQLKDLLEINGHTCLAVGDGTQARKLLQKAYFDFIILNGDLQELNGIDLCRQTRLLKPGIPILILVPSTKPQLMSLGFDAGADDCMTIPFESEELLIRIHAIAKRKSGKEHESSPVLKYADVELNRDTRMVKRNEVEIDLTPKEFSLLEYMIENQGKTLSREEIAQHVWSAKPISRMNLVDVYVTYLRKKIDQPFQVKLIHTKHWVGYIFK